MSFSKTVTTMCRHFDQDERQTGGSRFRDSIKSVLAKKFSHEGAPRTASGFCHAAAEP